MKTKNVEDLKFLKIKFVKANFENTIIYKPSLGSSEVPQKFWTRSAVLKFIGYNKQLNRH